MTMFPNIGDELLEDEKVIIQKPKLKSPEVIIKIGSVKVTALIDTGSVINGISEDWYNKNKAEIGKFEILGVNNTVIIGAVGKRSRNIRKQIMCQVDLNGHVSDCVFLIIPHLICDCIIGMQYLQQEGCLINIPKKYMVCEQTNSGRDNNEPQKMVNHIPLLNVMTEEEGENIEERIQEKLREVNGIGNEHLEQLQRILMENKSVFSKRPGRITQYQHQIQFTDRTYFFQKGWPVPIKYREAVDGEIDRMLKYNIIERAQTPYINPMVTVIKKDGTVRLCLDARRLNSVIVPDHEGPISINELLASCPRMNVMSTIDLTSSFWQIPLKEECRDYTGFLYNGRCYRYVVTPFGLSTSLSGLTRGLDTVLEKEVKDFTIIYVDDCLCYSQDITTHLNHLEALLRNFKNVNLTINLEKTHFFRKEINYLGFCLTTEGIRTTPEKVAAILNFPSPKNPKQLKGFLGLTNYYNRFTAKYAEYTQPLLHLLQKGVKFKWSPQHEEQFKVIKQLFIKTVMLKFPYPGRRYFLQTDASDYAYGGQLYQLDNNNEIAVVAFTSKTFKAAQRNYFTTEKELLALVECLKKFRVYILGQPLTVITDNKAITFLQKCHLNNARMTRWILSIQEYQFEIIHCKGKENIIADILSRYPEDQNDTTNFEVHHEYHIYRIQQQLSSETKKNLRNLSKLQLVDDKLNKLIDNITNNKNNNLCNMYKIEKGQLYRKCKGYWKAYIPEGMCQTLIKEIHELYGHIGPTKLYKTLKEGFTMDSMMKKIKQFTKVCDTCQKYKDTCNRNLVGETQPMLPEKRGELVSVDYYGPLPTSTGNVKYIFVIVDNFTKFAKLYAVRSATTAASVRRLKQYIAEYGKPDAVLSDNGTQFTSKKWVKELQQLQIKPKFTAVRNPCTNIVERWNRQLGNLFRVFAGEKHTKWAMYIPIIEACLNEVYQETIEMTPWEAQFGKKPRRIWEQYLHGSTKDEASVDTKQIFLKIKEKTTRQADRINARNITSDFQIGDKVLVRAQNVSDATQGVVSKFCVLYEGPFIIKNKLGRATYELAECKHPSKIRGKFNIRQLKQYNSGTLT